MAGSSATGVACAETSEAERREGLLGANTTAGRGRKRDNECIEKDTEKATRAKSESQPGHDEAASREDA